MAVLSNLWIDIRYAARRLHLSPAFTTAAVATIALGVGINTGIFSVLNGLVLREVPAPDAEELVSIHQIIEGDGVVRMAMGARSMFSTSEYRTYRDRVETLSGIMGYSRPQTVTLGGETPQEIRGALVTCNYFDVLRLPPATGRSFAADNCEPDAARTVVLGHELWTTRFGADPAIVGGEVLLNRQSFTVLGIAAEGARGVDREPVAFFAPTPMVQFVGPAWDVFNEERASWLTLIGRRAGDSGLEHVRAELGVIAAQIDAQQPPRRTTLVVSRARPNSLPEARPTLLAVGGVVMSAFGLVLLIACANVANLLLARATARRREIAVRLSLGASRARIVQQLLAESVLIAGAGGVLGSILAMWSFQGLVAFALSALPADAVRLTIDMSPDAGVLAYALALTLATGLFFGLAPALQASKPELHAAMKADATGAHPRDGNRMQAVLVGMQVAVCMVLMIAAGLLLRGLSATQTVEPGFEYKEVVVASFDLGGSGYNAASATAFQRQLMQRVSSLPGVESVAQATVTPLTTEDMDWTARVPGQDQWFPIGFNNVSPDYFSLIAIPIVRGRTFTNAEIDGSSTVAIVTETTARRHWPDQDPIGQVITMSGGPDASNVDLRVVGIAKDAQLTAIGEIASDYVYLPATPERQASLQLLARSRVDFGATAAAIRRAVAELDPGLVVRVAPLEANIDVWRSLAALVSSLSTSLGVLALVLASVGVYGVVAYAVGRRVREIGIRTALGASAHNVLALILQRTMRPVVVGAVIGLIAAVVVSRVLSSVLFGVSPVDPIGLGGAALFVIAVALGAGVLAARPGMRADPMVTLRYE